MRQLGFWGVVATAVIASIVTHIALILAIRSWACKNLDDTWGGRTIKSALGPKVCPSA